MKKKTISLLMAASLAASSLAGGIVSFAEESDPITLSVWAPFTGSDGDVLREIIDNYNETNTDNITVQIDIMDNATLQSKLPTAVSTGTGPSFVLVGIEFLQQYAKNGLIEDISDFWDVTGIDKSNFYENVLAKSYVGDTQYGVPMQYNLQYLYYNKDIFEAAGLDPETPPTTLDELKEKYGKLPGTLHSFSPILLPIVLIALSSVAAFPGSPFGTGFLYTFITFIGNPVVALLLGVFLAITLIPAQEKSHTLEWVTQGVTDSAAILAITGAGGSFGAILKLLPIADSVGGLVSTGIGILIPFIIASILKLAMGASTVAMITTAGMMAPLMETMGYTSPLAKVLVVMAIGAGSMVASHANDSYFWVVSQFSDMKTEEAYKCQTGMTAVMGITIIILLFVISLFI